MGKIALKHDLGDAHELRCYICGEAITADEIERGLVDTDRLIPKAENNAYSIDTTRLVCPVCHMKRHGNHRIRPESLGALKMAIDDREQWLKLRNKINNQLLAFERNTDELPEVTLSKLKTVGEDFHVEEQARVKLITKLVNGMKDEPLVASMLNVQGLGPMTIAYLLTYLVPEKAKHASSYVKYAGLHAPSHERYTKGETSGGNKRLRTALWRTVDSMWKSRDNPYRQIGVARKERLAESEKQVLSRNTQGKSVTVAWKDTKPGHRHGTAYRVMMKRILIHYWVVSRKFAGLPTDAPYVEAHLGHETDDPRDYGWLFPE